MSNANSLSNSIGLYTRKPMPAITALASAITTALTLEYSNLRGLSIGCREVKGARDEKECTPEQQALRTVRRQVGSGFAELGSTVAFDS